ncbi:MAG TPA: YhfC family intramembrane metalloprotease [Clostridiales bacterium]|nr:YhfC family intramembrane metalloprotease [Clostridiales bacterium]
MISPTAILFMMITLVISILAPIVFLLILLRGRKGVFSAWIAGALGFFVAQIIIRIPALQFLGTQAWFQSFAEKQPLVFAFGLALTAGLFETAARYIVLQFGLGKRLSFTTGLAAGAGHGSIESIVLIGLTYVNNLVISLAINSGTLSSVVPDQAMAANLIKTMTAVPQDAFLAAGLERLFTMALHIALSVLLCYFLVKQQPFPGFMLVLAIHTAVDFLAAALQSSGTGIWPIEGVLAVIAVLSVLLVLWLKPKFKDQQDIPPDPGEQAVREGY